MLPIPGAWSGVDGRRRPVLPCDFWLGRSKLGISPFATSTHLEFTRQQTRNRVSSRTPPPPGTGTASPWVNSESVNIASETRTALIQLYRGVHTPNACTYPRHPHQARTRRAEKQFARTDGRTEEPEQGRWEGKDGAEEHAGWVDGACTRCAEAELSRSRRRTLWRPRTHAATR